MQHNQNMNDLQKSIAYNNVGITASENNLHADAVEYFKSALHFAPKNSQIMNNLGGTYTSLGEYEKAIEILDKAIEINPEFVQAYYNRGNAQKNLGEIKLATKDYQKALEINPDFIAIYNNLGVAFGLSGQIEKAIEMFKVAIEKMPDNPSGYINLGAAYSDIGKYELAIQTMKRALVLNQNTPEAHSNLANTLRIVGNVDLAKEHATRAIEINPNYASAHKNLGIINERLDEYKEAIKNYTKAIEIDPNSEDALAYLCYVKKKASDWRGLDEYSKKHLSILTQKLENNIFIETPAFINLILHGDEKLNKQLAIKVAEEIQQKSQPVFKHKNKRVNSKRIKLGYLADNFHNHPVTFALSDVILNHSKNFDTFIYSYGFEEENETFNQITKNSTFRDIRLLSHRQAAEAIKKDEIDILVDIKGYTTNHRTEIAAFRPAPVQIWYLGFPGTSGANFFDYFLVDDIVLPKKHASHFTEELIYLPRAYQMTSKINFDSGKFSRTDFGLAKEKFVFSAFHRAVKIDKKTFDTWLEILHRTPKSVLWLFDDNHLATENLKSYAHSQGLARKRLIFSEALPINKHLARLSLSDLGLDSFSYSGGATTSFYLQAGVPVLTKIGNTFIQRMSASILHTAGLDNFIVQTKTNYIKKAVSFAKNKPTFTIDKSMFGGKSQAKILEAAYKKTWRKYTKNK